MPGYAQVVVHLHPARAIDRCAEQAAQRRRRHAGGPQYRAAGQAPPTRPQAVGVDVFDGCIRQHFHAQAFELMPCASLQGLGQMRQHRRSGLDQTNARGAWIDVAELRAQRVSGDVGERARELHPGRAPTDDREVQPCVAQRGVRRRLGVLECGEHPVADLECILEGLQSRCMACPLVVAEVRMGCAARQHEEVVVMGGAVGGFDAAFIDVDVFDRGQQDLDIGLPTQDVA